MLGRRWVHIQNNKEQVAKQDNNNWKRMSQWCQDSGSLINSNKAKARGVRALLTTEQQDNQHQQATLMELQSKERIVSDTLGSTSKE